MFFDSRKISKQWRESHESFRHCETENFWLKNVILPIIHEIFRLPQIFWNIEEMSMGFCGTVGSYFFDGKMRYAPSPIFFRKKFLETRSFLKNSRISLQKLSTLWDGEFLTEKHDNPYYA